MIAAALVALLKEKNLTISTAESLTAGLVSSAISEVSGASAVFKGGVSTYLNETKVSLLGVSEQAIANFGAVSAEVAQQMAQRVRTKLQTDCAIATTGIAGPDSLEGKAVGLVYLGFCDDNRLVVKELNLSGDRAQIRQQSAELAIDFALTNLQNR